ncbi:MAG TPA: adenylate/guanylate cyclase domain-containing protein [Rhodocyclaceae bacterium]|nr:adenylate/guanylate cyclase domain-containing protein [Rhodocyclaceae bacterium]
MTLPMIDPNDAEMLFVEDGVESPSDESNGWLILLVDDDLDIHAATKIALNGVEFRGKPLKFISAFSGLEAITLVTQTPGIALILLDVVMETESSGLDVVRRIRNELNNRLVQIILRTGQPGRAPEEKVIVDYEINDYKSKSELTAQRLFTMVLASLRSYEQLIAIEQQKAALSCFAQAANRFVPKEFLRVLQKSSITETLLGEKTSLEMTILFLDVRSFITLSEKLSPQKTFEFINSLFDWISPLIRRHEGFIDKYLGDGILALFPRRVDDALEAVLEIRYKLSSDNLLRIERRESPIFLGMGIHFGVLVLGIVGEPERLEATVIGDAVNTASRLESMTKQYSTDTLISEAAVTEVSRPENYRFQFIEQAELRGKQDKIGLYKLLDPTGISATSATVPPAPTFSDKKMG